MMRRECSIQVEGIVVVMAVTVKIASIDPMRTIFPAHCMTRFVRVHFEANWSTRRFWLAAQAGGGHVGVGPASAARGDLPWAVGPDPQQR